MALAGPASVCLTPMRVNQQEVLLDFAMSYVRGFYVFNAFVILLFCFVFYGRRFLWRRGRRRGKRNLGFFPTHAAAGNALQSLQMIAQSRVEYVLDEKFEDEADDDDEGGPPDPTNHLKRQLRRIRNGEKLERLTVCRDRDNSASSSQILKRRQFK
jgi:hypothetical protein